MTGALTSGHHLVQAGTGTSLPAEAEVIEVPSGQPVSLQDVILNEPGPEGVTMRFRFLAPQIAREGGSVDFDTAIGDMAFLCDSYALPRALGSLPQPSQIIISLSDMPVVFGEASPDATQFFEAYSLQDGACIWEIY